MRFRRENQGGSFTANGETIQPAEIHLVFSDLTLEEYRQVDERIRKTFGEPEVPKHMQKLILSGGDLIHDGGNPAEGREANDPRGFDARIPSAIILETR